jgi:uncharacterized DUF497 family protein
MVMLHRHHEAERIRLNSKCLGQFWKAEVGNFSRAPKSRQAKGRVVIVVYAWRGNDRRIISARKATKAEQKEYYSAIYPSEEQ